ncbi:MAG: hypothetical protein DBY18_04575 [Clostridia bacterium]|nr:MAG: hypothetical protein DBY18_04575 [Clostridia bacterium]
MYIAYFHRKKCINFAVFCSYFNANNKITAIYRDKLEDLIAWKNDKNRKPLILIGARQVILENSRVMEWNFGSDTKNAPGKWSGRWGGRTHNLNLGKHRSFFLFSGFSVIADTTGTMIPSHLVLSKTQVLVKFCKNSMNLKK